MAVHALRDGGSKVIKIRRGRGSQRRRRRCRAHEEVMRARALPARQLSSLALAFAVVACRRDTAAAAAAPAPSSPSAIPLTTLNRILCSVYFASTSHSGGWHLASSSHRRSLFYQPTATYVLHIISENLTPHEYGCGTYSIIDAKVDLLYDFYPLPPLLARLNASDDVADNGAIRPCAS